MEKFKSFIVENQLINIEFNWEGTVKPKESTYIKLAKKQKFIEIDSVEVLNKLIIFSGYHDEDDEDSVEDFINHIEKNCEDCVFSDMV